MSKEDAVDTETEDTPEATAAQETAQPSEGEALKQAAEVADLRQQLEAMTAKADENWDKALRIQAELQNIQRRSERELQNAHRFGSEKFATEMLAVADSLLLGLQNSENPEADVATLKEGMTLTHQMLMGAFEKFAVTPVKALGEVFDPAVHEAISMVPTPDAAPNTVLTVVQEGYMIHDRLLRPARVVVTKEAE